MNARLTNCFEVWNLPALKFVLFCDGATDVTFRP